MAKKKNTEIQIGDILYETISVACVCEEVPIATMRVKIKEADGDPKKLQELLDKTRGVTLEDGTYYNTMSQLSSELKVPVSYLKGYINKGKPLTKEDIVNNYSKREGKSNLIICGKRFNSVVEASTYFGVNSAYMYQQIYACVKDKKYPNKELDAIMQARLDTGTDKKSKCVTVGDTVYPSYASIARAFGLSEVTARKYCHDITDPWELKKKLEDNPILLVRVGNKVLTKRQSIAKELGISMYDLGKMLKEMKSTGKTLQEILTRHNTEPRKRTKININLFNHHFSSLTEMENLLSIHRMTLNKYFAQYGMDESKLEDAIKGYRNNTYRGYTNKEYNGKLYPTIFDMACDVNKPVKELIVELDKVG